MTLLTGGPLKKHWPPSLGPVLLIAGMGLLFFARLVLHPSWILYSDFSDLLAYQIPHVRFLVGSWQETGELPLWCPYSFAGMPFIHDIQVGAFYPPHAFLYRLPQEWIGPALSWLIVVHVILAGWTMFAYARHQGLCPTCAMVAAVGYMFAGKWLLHLLAAGQYVMVGLAWLPMVILLLERAIRGRSLLAATWAGVALGMVVLGSHPQISFYAGLFIALWALAPAMEVGGVGGTGFGTRRSLAWALWSWFATVAWCGLVALALVSVQLLPALEAAAHATRSVAGIPYRPLADLLLLLGGLIGSAPEGLPPTMRWEYRTGWSVLWLATALQIPVLARGEIRLRLQAAICLALVLFGMGGATVFQSLPGFRLFRLPARMLLITPLPMALLVGAGTQRLFQALRANQCLSWTMRRMLTMVLVLGLISNATLISLSNQLPATPVLVYWGSLLFTFPIACWLLKTGAGNPDQFPRWNIDRMQVAWAALLATDLWAMAWPLVSVCPERSVYAPSYCVQYLEASISQHQRILDRDVAGEPASTPLGFALPLLRRLESVRGYNPLDIHRYKEFIQFIGDRDGQLDPGGGILDFPIINKPLLDLLGVRYLLQPSRYPKLAGEQDDIDHDPRWQERSEDPDPQAFLFVAGGMQRLPRYKVYENREVLPRAFVVSRAESLPALPHVLEVLRQANLREVVYLEDNQAEPGSRQPVEQFRTASILAYEPNHIIVEVDLESPGYLVLTDPWYPGWIATVDGRTARLFRADYLFRAVAVPAGRHLVNFDFDPTSYRLGRGISLAAVAGVMGFTLYAVARRPRRRGDTTSTPPTNFDVESSMG